MNTISYRNRLYPFELALLLSLCVTLLVGVRVGAEQRALADKVVRLHVLAVSDSEEDQAVKLRVREAVLARLEPALEQAESAAEAAAMLEKLLPELERLARWVSGEGQVRVTLCRENYPTRRYGDFALPAGEYTSLRIELGAAEGQNWWCVVYPPLCTGSAVETVRETAALEEEELRLITGDGEGYVIRFRLMELWGELVGKTLQ